jgi:tRNA pseudouridine55 synthase
VRFYELARRGEEVPDVSKEVTVGELARTGGLVGGRMPFRLSCSSGTYARAIAHDLGQALGCGGHLSALRRTAIGPFRADDALRLDEIARRREASEPLGAAWLPRPGPSARRGRQWMRSRRAAMQRQTRPRRSTPRPATGPARRPAGRADRGRHDRQRVGAGLGRPAPDRLQARS